MSGLVQTLICKREGRIVWEKKIYVRDADREACYAKYLCKAYGVFFYDLAGDIQTVSRKPRNVPHWHE